MLPLTFKEQFYSLIAIVLQSYASQATFIASVNKLSILRNSYHPFPVLLPTCIIFSVNGSPDLPVSVLMRSYWYPVLWFPEFSNNLMTGFLFLSCTLQDSKPCVISAVSVCVLIPWQSEPLIFFLPTLAKRAEVSNIVSSLLLLRAGCRVFCKSLTRWKATEWVYIPSGKDSPCKKEKS